MIALLLVLSVAAALWGWHALVSTCIEKFTEPPPPMWDDLDADAQLDRLPRTESTK